MRNASVPIGIEIPGKPNIADTLWLTVSDQKNKVYYCQDTDGIVGSPDIHTTITGGAVVFRKQLIWLA